MRLSEAILLGSTILKPIARKTFSPDNYDGSPTHGCALGMMAAARGCMSLDDWRPAIHGKGFNWANGKLPAMPCGCKRGVDYHDRQFFNGASIQDAIMHVFNEHVMGKRKAWTLEQLCQWVDSIDPTPRESVVPSHVETAEEMLKTVERE